LAAISGWWFLFLRDIETSAGVLTLGTLPLTDRVNHRRGGQEVPEFDTMAEQAGKRAQMHLRVPMFPPVSGPLWLPRTPFSGLTFARCAAGQRSR